MTDSGTFVSRALWWASSWSCLSIFLGWEPFSTWYWAAPTEQKLLACGAFFFIVNVALIFSGLDGNAPGAPEAPGH